MSDFVVPVSAAEHPPCMDKGGPRFPCFLRGDHSGDHRDSIGNTWARGGGAIDGLRRLPWVGEDGKAAYVTPGDGLVNHMADAAEDQILEMAQEDARRALALVDESTTSLDALRVAIRYLTSAVTDAAFVAELRAERLPAADAAAGEALWREKAREIGQALREAIHHDDPRADRLPELDNGEASR